MAFNSFICVHLLYRIFKRPKLESKILILLSLWYDPNFLFFFFPLEITTACFVPAQFNRKILCNHRISHKTATYFPTSSIHQFCCMQWLLRGVLDMLFTHCDRAQTLAFLHTRSMRKTWKFGAERSLSQALTLGVNFPVQWVGAIAGEPTGWKMSDKLMDQCTLWPSLGLLLLFQSAKTLNCMMSVTTLVLKARRPT